VWVENKGWALRVGGGMGARSFLWKQNEKRFARDLAEHETGSGVSKNDSANCGWNGRK